MLGDVIEWLGGFALVLAAFMYLGWPLALLAIGLFLLYQAQCLSGNPIPRPWKKSTPEQ